MFDHFITSLWTKMFWSVPKFDIFQKEIFILDYIRLIPCIHLFTFRSVECSSTSGFRSSLRIFTSRAIMREGLTFHLHKPVSAFRLLNSDLLVKCIRFFYEFPLKFQKKSISIDYIAIKLLEFMLIQQYHVVDVLFLLSTFKCLFLLALIP